MNKLDIKKSLCELYLLDSNELKIIKERRNWTLLLRDSVNYYRVGLMEILAHELYYHLLFEKYWFRVPKILDSSIQNNFLYIKESSIWNEHFWKKLNNNISNKDEFELVFENMLNICNEYFIRQKSIGDKTINIDEILISFNVEYFLKEFFLDKELYDLANEIKTKIVSILWSKQKWELTHWDFNPFNILDSWIIDFENSLIWPINTDKLSFLFTQIEVPRAWTELSQYYKLDVNNIDKILKLFNYSWNYDYLFILKLFWLTVNLSDKPLLQKYRINNFKKYWKQFLIWWNALENFIDFYLNNDI